MGKQHLHSPRDPLHKSISACCTSINSTTYSARMSEKSIYAALPKQAEEIPPGKRSPRIFDLVERATSYFFDASKG